jgi:hypothetical protein
MLPDLSNCTSGQTAISTTAGQRVIHQAHFQYSNETSNATTKEEGGQEIVDHRELEERTTGMKQRDELSSSSCTPFTSFARPSAPARVTVRTNIIWSGDREIVRSFVESLLFVFFVPYPIFQGFDGESL